MVVTGIMGSPRKKGNTSYLLNTVFEEFQDHGAETNIVHVPDLKIHPCTGCSLCEKKGFCHFDDDMQKIIFPLIRKSDIIIIATPVYFFTVPSEMKSMIDRTQTLWARKYKLGLTDPSEVSRKVYLLSVGATREKALFDGIHLTMKYFSRGIGADYSGSLTYNGIENPGELKHHPTVYQDAENAVYDLISKFNRRSTVLFTCKGNSERSQMAAAFARKMAGNRLNVITGGGSPEENLHPIAVRVMAEKNIDIDFYSPEHVNHVIRHNPPDYVVSIGSGEETSFHIPDAKSTYWWIPDPWDKPIDFFRVLRDEIEGKVRGFIADLNIV